MRFFVYSRSAIEALAPHDEPHVIVSITSHASDRARLRTGPACRGVLRVAFADIDAPSGDLVVFDRSHARAICSFVLQHRDAIASIVVHCDAGVSRSAGVAAALAKALGEDDTELFRRHRPNPHVYRTVLEAWASFAPPAGARQERP